MMRQLSCVCALLLAFACLAEARTWYIEPDGSGDALTIQAGLDSAAVGDTVLLACGTYYEHGIAMISDIVLRGETGDPRDVIIDAQSQGYVIYCGGLGTSASLEGLTITGGLASSGNGYVDGGGMSCLSCQVQISQCIFSHNVAEDNGGAIYIQSGSPELTACTFWENYAGQQGGAIMCFLTGSPALAGCTFYRNGAGWRNGGSALMCWESSAVVENTIIADGMGGAAVMYAEAGDARLSCCCVYGNVGGDWYGAISGQNGIDGNFSECPAFCNAPGGDFGLCDESPCLPGNHPDGYACGLIGAWGQACVCEPTRNAASAWGAIKAMYR